MKSSANQTIKSKTRLASLLMAATVALGGVAANAQTTPGVFPPDSTRYGNDYGGWSAAWWTWFMQAPVSANGIDHPGINGNFDVTEGQTGDVWFLAGVFGTVVRNGPIRWPAQCRVLQRGGEWHHYQTTANLRQSNR